MRYEETYAKAHPFDTLVDGMLDPGMIDDTVHIIRDALALGVSVNVIINNRSGGNAPLIAQQLATRFASERNAETGGSAREKFLSIETPPRKESK